MITLRILAHFVRHTLDGFRCLQHRDGGVELLQELLEVVRVIDEHELPDDVGIGRGERRAGSAGELDQGFGAERAIEMDVEFGLGEPGDELTREGITPMRRECFGRRRLEDTEDRAGSDRFGGCDVDAAGVGGAGRAGEEGGAERRVERGDGIGDGGGRQ